MLESGMVFTSLTHGKSPDCRQANAVLKEKLEDYNFGAYVLEKNCWRCPNNDCNLSFVFILPKTEFFRLKNQVKFDTRPTFLLHRSFKELLGSDKQLRGNVVDKKHVETQFSPEMKDMSVETVPATQEAEIQTENPPTVEKSPEQVNSEENDDDVVMRPPPRAPLPPKQVKQEIRQDEDEEKNNSDNSDSSIRSESSGIPETPVSSIPVVSLLRRASAGDACSPVSKKMRIGDVEQCNLCWMVSEFDGLTQYCQHILETHTSIFRFTCNSCSFKFADSKRAQFHVARCVRAQEKGDAVKFDPMIPNDQLIKFYNTAINCYPEKFRGVQIQTLEEALRSLP